MRRGNKKCPNCGTPVPWSRLWLKTWIWAEWPCPQCKATLEFSMRRRTIASIIFGVCIGLICAFVPHGFVWYRILAVVIGVALLCTAIYWFFDSINIKKACHSDSQEFQNIPPD
jgi:CXXC-20-CXXC protein